MKQVARYALIICIAVFFCSTCVLAEPADDLFLDKGIPSRAIPFNKAKRVAQATSASTNAVKYRVFETPVQGYAMNNPYIVDDRYVVFGEYDRQDKCRVALFDMDSETAKYYSPLNKSWWIEEVVADNNALYWIELVSEPHIGWALVRQPRDGSTATRLRSKAPSASNGNIPRPAYDGRYIVWQECTVNSKKEVKQFVAVYDTKTEKLSKLTDINRIWDSNEKLKVENGKVSFLDQGSKSTKWLIRCFDVASKKELFRLTAGNRFMSQPSFDGTFVAFLTLNKIYDHQGVQYSYNIKTGELHRVIGKNGWLSDMSDGNMVCIVPGENAPHSIFLGARKKLLKLPNATYNGHSISTMRGSMTGNLFATIGVLVVDETSTSPGYVRDHLVVYTFPEAWMK